MPFVNDYKSGRTEDSETGAYLACDKVRFEPDHYEFSFYWQGERIQLLAYRKLSSIENSGPNEKSDVHWDFFQVGIPGHMKDQREEIIDMIKQAFKGHGSGRGSRFEKQVTAEFIPP